MLSAKDKEASARVKINKLLEESGWRFEDDEYGKANIRLEKMTHIVNKLEGVGDDYEKTTGFIDYLLLDVDGSPLIVLEAKREKINPLAAKEQARNYARNVGARFVILSNGNLSYLWDTLHGNPEIITKFPTQESISQYVQYSPNPSDLIAIKLDENYIVETQLPSFKADPLFQDENRRVEFLRDNHLKQLRPYQVQAVRTLQLATMKGSNRFLFEMATGTGKTLVSAAVIKTFLKSGNASRVLFLVDRLELEDQAYKAFKNYLGKDFTTVIYKKAREDWQNASIVVSTIQSFLAGDKYKSEFSPTDFQLVISDEAHRSIGGNSRAVFEYFVGYKLGLTATPKDYLKGFDEQDANTQREFERRQLLDTYKTFGCEAGEPTFRYDLIAGVKDGYLVNPIVADARTEITTGLLSDEGLAVHKVTDEDQTIDAVLGERDYEKKFFNEATNIAMCKAFIENGIFDPIVKKRGKDLFGKSIVFCVSQKHAAKVTNILNKLAFEKWPNEYGESDFAMQVSSEVTDAQQMTINFSNNVLGGKTRALEGYESSKTRVTVTVGMMTTGYDCQDILNLALMRPVFSPSDFVQIKGRGTRPYSFSYEDDETKMLDRAEKVNFKFFDYFATCEYFEKEYTYDEKINLPRIIKVETVNTKTGKADTDFIYEGGKKVFKGPFDLAEADEIKTIQTTGIGEEGMRIDREGFKRAVEKDVLSNKTLRAMWENGDADEAEEYTKKNIFDKPNFYLNLEKIRNAFGVDRRIGVREFLQYAFGEKDTFEMKDDLLESEWNKFQEIYEVDQDHFEVVKTFFKAYVTDENVREILQSKQTARFNTESSFGFDEYEKLNGFKHTVPQYVKDYISLNTFIS